MNTGKLINRTSKTPWIIYVLSLENDKYYIGATTDVDRRKKEHILQSKKSANWCKKNKPLNVIETFETNTFRMKEAVIVEDIITLQYIKKFGVENVRGGRYFGSNRKIKTKSNSHILKGYIHMFHLLLERFNISVGEIEEIDAFDYVNDFHNDYRINMTIKWCEINNLTKDDLLERIKQKSIERHSKP